MNWVFISQKTALFIVTAMKTSNLTHLDIVCKKVTTVTKYREEDLIKMLRNHVSIETGDGVGDCGGRWFEST
jgi:hypothetical protein